MKANLLANLFGKGWVGVLNLLVVPFYLRLLSVEEFGLVGLFAVLQSFTVLLDLGITGAVTRELARNRAGRIEPERDSDLVYTLEIVYLIIGVLIAASFLIFSQQMIELIIGPSNIESHRLRNAFILMGLTLAAQWPISFYSGGLIGIERQVLYNIINSLSWTARTFGALTVVYFSSDSLLSFFGCQFIVCLATTLALRSRLWSLIRTEGYTPRFQRFVLQNVWRYSGLLAYVTIVLLILNHIDKFVVSRSVSLQEFAYYSLAWQVIGALYLLYSPVYSTVLPIIVRYWKLGDQDNFLRVYRQGYELMSIIIVPMCVTLYIESWNILELWTGQREVAANASLLLSALTIGAGMNALFFLPFALQQASDTLVLSARWLSVSMFCMLVLIFPVTFKFGMLGAVVLWSSFSALHDVLISFLTYQKIKSNEFIRWSWRGLLLPLIVAAIGGLIGSFMAIEDGSLFSRLVELVAVFSVSFFAVLLVSPVCWNWLPWRFSRAPFVS